MQELYNIGISENTIKCMLEFNPDLSLLSDSEIIKKIDFLRNVGCSDSQILNIVSSNSLFLSRENEELVSLVKYLLEVGFTSLNILFDSNPYILNLDVFEIRNYIDSKVRDGINIIDVIDELESNIELFNEV